MTPEQARILAEHPAIRPQLERMAQYLALHIDEIERAVCEYLAAGTDAAEKHANEGDA